MIQQDVTIQNLIVSKEISLQANSAVAQQLMPTTKLTEDAQIQISAEDQMRGYTKVFRNNCLTGRPNQVLICTICGRQFFKICNVLDHIRVHRGSQPFSCDYCGKTFAQQGNRDTHMKAGACKRRAERIKQKHEARMKQILKACKNGTIDKS